MWSQLCCRPRLPTIQQPQNKVQVHPASSINAYIYIQSTVHIYMPLTSLMNSWERKSIRENLGGLLYFRNPVI
jgi:hypothetical protein